MENSELIQKIVSTTPKGPQPGGTGNSLLRITGTTDSSRITLTLHPRTVAAVRRDLAPSFISKSDHPPKGNIITGVKGSPEIDKTGLEILKDPTRASIQGPPIPLTGNHEHCIAKNSGDEIIIPPGTLVLKNDKDQSIQLIEGSPHYCKDPRYIPVFSQKVYRKGESSPINFNNSPGDGWKGMRLSMHYNETQSGSSDTELLEIVRADLPPNLDLVQGRRVLATKTDKAA